ncbi:unnamed protein product [Notodromas monacha]|uniref:[heparan sulfate]-glucosamine N-sulfotransferase n=1 Tax=Notodromas monacha TaxID=399045 RepID=A0A7R9GDJ4_9CRUS|nr:unnamed protein product [Notodromas monacha]CAG0918609.1 unnamed protein product [Notodromas monacha]
MSSSVEEEEESVGCFRSRKRGPALPLQNGAVVGSPAIPSISPGVPGDSWSAVGSIADKSRVQLGPAACGGGWAPWKVRRGTVMLLFRNWFVKRRWPVLVLRAAATDALRRLRRDVVQIVHRHSSLAAARQVVCILLAVAIAVLLVIGSDDSTVGEQIRVVGEASGAAAALVPLALTGDETPVSPTSHQTAARLRLDPRALLFVDSPYSRTGRDIAMWLVANRIRYKTEVLGKSLPVLTYEDKGKFGVVIFENVMRYLNMDSWHRSILDRYMIEYHVGMIGFMPTAQEEIGPSFRFEKLGHFPLLFQPRLRISDRCQVDGIDRVLFGAPLNFWLHRLIFLDALSFLSRGRLSVPLMRYIQLDIDDIFVGKQGIRLTRDDVIELLAAQDRLKRVIDGFRYNLGFSGHYFHHGSRAEDEGDDMLIVAPHHSGVYPVHEELYSIWKEVWDIKVTATEEYPHLKPPRLRRGFVYRGIQVLPRQTCGLYTTNLFYDSYPGGKARLDNMIRGGELFQTIVANQFSVFMTHMSNYGNDRLALYTFESVFKFLRCWTNLEFRTVPPVELANRYFRTHPDERDPVWESPCHDKRHREIWSPLKTCSRLPNLLVLGPQKTGTTALYAFLSMHPSVQSNRQSPDTFEETQFFSGRNYLRGLDWYMSFFPEEADYLFEKSANYFDGDVVPKRAHALVPKADLIVTAKEAAVGDKALRDLRNRCLYPGLYAHHLERWLQHFPPQQLHIVDGEALKLNPVVVMNSLQKELNITPFFDYANHLSFDSRKGFFCKVDGEKRTRCLGKSKGRKYPPMDEHSAAFLKRYYMSGNVALEKLLKRLGYAIPAWLKEDLAELPTQNESFRGASPDG